MRTIGRGLRTILRNPRLIVELLQSLRTEKRTVLIATHDEAIAAKADLILKMRDGRLIDPAGS